MSEPRVALTFDAEHGSRAGADTSAPARILDALGRASVRATFFVQGRWASADREIAARIVADGHLVGNHSNYHAPMTLLSPDGIRADVAEAERRIHEVTGADPRPWFRCPFGDGEDSPEVRDGLARLGYRIVPWTLDSGDWRDDATAGAVRGAVANGVRAGGAAVVLFHTWPRVTAEALPDVLADLSSRRVEFVTVEELADGA
ncbi:MAG: polysaccharide deacetylase family protein [Actinomycetota bacterium]